MAEIDSGFNLVLALSIGGSASLLMLYRALKTESLVAPTSIASLLLLGHFVIPGLLSSAGIINLDWGLYDQYRTEAAWFTLLCYGAVITGMAAARRVTVASPIAPRHHNAKPPQSRVVSRKNLIVSYATLLILAGWLMRFYVIEQGAYFQILRTESLGFYHAQIRLIEELPFYAVGLLFLVQAASRKNRRVNEAHSPVTYYIIAVWVLEIGYWLVAGRKFQAIVATGWPIVAHSLYGLRYNPKQVMAVIALVIFGAALFPIAHVYRQSMYGVVGKADARDVVAYSLSYVRADWGQVNPLEVSVDRLNLLKSVAGSVGLIETKSWPQRWGEDYIKVAANAVPRVVWPQKPSVSYGNEFGRSVGIIRPDNRKTSVSVTFIGESYVNFKWLGAVVFVVFGMLVEGLWKFAKQGSDEIRKAVYLVSLPWWIYIGGTAANYIIGGIKAVGVIVGGYWLYRELVGSRKMSGR